MSLFENRAKINASLAAFIGLAGAASWFQPDVAGSDLWWHLASGRQIWQQGQIPSVDSFSFTFQGHEWMNHEWLWDCLYWPAYALHPQLVALLNFSILLAVFACAGLLARRAGASPWASALVLWAAAASASWFLDIRPHLTTLLYLEVFLLLRERSWAPWTWPALMLLWVNTHGGFVFGLGAIGLHVLWTTLQGRRGEVPPDAVRRAWIGLGLAFAAMLVNPWGYRILEYPLAYVPGLGATPYRSLVEWQAPGLGLLDYRGLGWLLTFQARFWMLVALALTGIAIRWRRDPYLAALALVTLVMAATARRFIPLFAVCSIPWIALAVDPAGRRVLELLGTLAESHQKRLRLAGNLAAALAVVLLWTSVQMWPDPLGRWTQRDLYPDAAVQYLKSLRRPLRILNQYNWGGFLMLHLPESRVFMDGRANTLYDDRIYADWKTFLNGEAGLQARLTRYTADLALLPDQEFARALQRLPRPWRIVYQDPIALILVPPDSPLQSTLPSPDVIAQHPQFLQQRARVLMSRGQLQGAEELLREALRRDPLMVYAYADLAALKVMGGDPTGADGVLAEARSAGKRRPQNLSVLEGYFYAQRGEVARAMRAFRAGLPLGPFDDPAPVLARIRAIDPALRRTSRPTG
jgi:tetratricopeptide (TPR) repeat protein